jgi:flagella basal body P-ring formation protein FlgA
MKKLFFLLILAAILFRLDSLNLILKEKVFVDCDIVRLGDIIEKSLENKLTDILISSGSDFPKRLSAEEVIRKLNENSFFDVNLTGKEVIVYKNGSITDQPRGEYKAENNPLRSLEKTLGEYFGKNYRIMVSVRDIKPFIELDSIYSDFKWELGKFDRGLKDLEKLRHISLRINDTNYNVNLDLNVYSDILVSNKNLKKGEFFKYDDFTLKNADIALFKEIESIAVNQDDVINTQFVQDIGSGEVLRWKHLKMVPLVKKGEKISYIINKNDIEVIIPCSIKEEGFLNQKVLVMLDNGKERYGILRKDKGRIYAESI